MALDALIFDLDGTLVDTNRQHIESWVRAFARHGYRIDADRIAPEVGKGGDNLVPAILGPAADARDGDALRESAGDEFVRIVEREQHVRVFDGVVELLAELRRRGVRTALATSSGTRDLDATFESAGLDLREHVDEVVMKDDVARSKPAPDVVAAALRKLALSPAQCAMVGDTPYDAEAAKRAGIVTLGILAGGLNDTRTLVAAGARQAWRDPAHLLADLDRALRVASPGAAHLTNDVLERLMREALREAAAGLAAGEVPVGCVVADGEARVVAYAHGETHGRHDRTAHAALLALQRAAERVPRDARDLVLVSTLEPCILCTGAAIVCAVDTIVYALTAPADSGTTRVRNPEDPQSQMPRLVGGVLTGESRTLLERWLGAHGGTREAGYVEQLLAAAGAR